MADISDVEASFVAAISAAIYPNGVSSPSTIIGPNGAVACRIYPGWPLPETLDADMIAGTPAGIAPVVNVSVHAQTGLERNTTRYPQEWEKQTTTPCSLTAAVNGVVITIGGTVAVGHYLTIQVDNAAFSYAAKANDTLATVASALGALMAAKMTVTVSGAAITLPATAGGLITIRSAAPGTAVRELERTMQRFIVTVWAPNNALRVATARIVRPSLAARDYFNLPDGYVAELKYESSIDIDRSGKQSLSCRDIYYWAEYPTTQTMVAYPITTFSAGIEIDTVATTIEPLPLASFTPALTTIN